MKPLLYVLPHAGGASHAYRPLARALEDAFELCCLDLPGHGRRARERPIDDMEQLATDLIGSLNQVREGRPWVLFGHSMGALLGHALCNRCLELGLPLPDRLYVSGSGAPWARSRKGIADLPESDFWKAVAGYGGVPAEVLGNRELADYFETLLRCDFRAVETYSPPPEALPVPIRVLYGCDDLSREEANSWQEASRNPIATHAFSGGHFYLFEVIPDLSRIIREEPLPVSA